jgi:GH43 family beta-xylosidase
MHPDETYLNPVYARPSPDPFVIKYLDTFWCYCTGPAADGRCFPILRSKDLVQWVDCGGAMDAINNSDREYWAPEVSYWDGLFYMYYSVGDGSAMHIRVAVADSPSGPFVDKGIRLTREEFAIDPHVFTDDDGRRWMFYATDFLQHTHIGTGTVRDLLLDSLTLAGHPTIVSRARFDWQVFDPERVEKGGVRWHTVEGPSVVKYKDHYFQMFSGGNWKNVSYGVGYAYTSDIASEEEWTQVCDGEATMPLLRTVPGRAIGPGHNCVIHGPDNRQAFCIYHRWNETGDARVICIDRMEFIDGRIVVFGPSITPQLLPNRPDPVEDSDHHEVRHAVPMGTGVMLEAWLRADDPELQANVRISLDDNGTKLLQFRFDAAGEHVDVFTETDQHSVVASYTSHRFPAGAYHRLQIEVSGQSVAARFDERQINGLPVLARCPTSLSIAHTGGSEKIASLSVTLGWADTFDGSAGLRELGWIADTESWSVASKQLWKTDRASAGDIFKRTPSESYEYVVNARVIDDDCEIGFYPSATATDPGPLILLKNIDDVWRLFMLKGESGKDSEVIIQMPAGFTATEYEQFRFRVHTGSLTIARQGDVLCTTSTAFRGTHVGIHASGAAAVDMVRVTALK